MNKLTLLLLLALPACVSQEQLAQERARTLARAEGVCQRLGVTADNPYYKKCLQSNAGDYGYKLVSDSNGQLAFVVPDPNGGSGPIGGGTFYPATYVPPVNAYR
jgi:hypothetical protein